MLAAVALLTMVSAAVGQSPPATIDGVAAFAGGNRPAAGLTLQIIKEGDPAHAVVVDSQGRFRVPAPRDWSVPQPNGTQAPCWAVAEPEGRWRIEPINRPPFHSNPESLRESVARGLSHPARAAWRNGVLNVECPEPGEVDVLVRGLDGKPLADRPVEVVPDAEALQAGGPVNARFSSRTDAKGRFLMRWFEGVRRLRVAAPGEGVCSTPRFWISSGRTTSVDTLPMTRVGSIAGRLAPGLVAPETRVVLEPEASRPAPCAADGRFEIRDVPPGRYLLRVSNAKPGGGAAQVTVWLAPGETIEGLTIDQMPPPTPEDVARSKKALERLNGRNGPNARDELWVEGVVRDLAGRPLSGVEVFIRTAYHGGIRMYEDVRRTTTDDQGRYAFRGPVHSFSESLVVVAKAKGRPPTLGHAPSRTVQRDQPSKLDLTLAESGGAASVRLTDQGGKPLAGAAVRLEAEGGANVLYGSGWARDAVSPARKALDAITTPATTTDPNGVARFTDLFPGLYTVRAGVFARSAFGGGGPGPILAVSPDREANATVAVVPFDHKARFQVLRPDGPPVASQDVGFEFGRSGRTYWNSSIKLDEKGVGEHVFELGGLWTVVVRFGQTPSNPFGNRDTPFYQAETQVPVSPVLASAAPIRITGAPHEPRPGSLRVRLLDVDGRPARGAVAFDGAVGATDERGEVRFEGLSEPRPGNRQLVSGFLEGSSPPPWSTAGPSPTDEALARPLALVPTTEVKIVPGREETVELRARPLGYVRGKLQPTEGRPVADYAIHPWHGDFASPPCWRFDLATGDFAAGPFPEGPATFQLSMKAADGGYQNCGKQIVQVVAGQVAHVDLTPGDPEPVDPSAAGGQVLLGMGGLSIKPGDPDAMAVTVFLPDGETPAHGAQAALYVPGHDQPKANGISDGGGRMSWQGGVWRIVGEDDRPKVGLVEKPTLVVSLPGRFGAVVVPLEKEEALRVVLPAAVDAEGAVKIGGRAPGADGSLVRVVAAHQGRGVLDGALGVAATVGLDGRFRLAGLTAGRYLVQAARDGLWASKPVEVVVVSGGPTPPLALEIPAPGETVTLEFVDRGGEPLAGESFALARPDGPFASIWPPTLRADPFGRLTLRGLEAGTHSISSTVSNESATFEVAEAGGPGAPPTVERIVLRRPAP